MHASSSIRATRVTVYVCLTFRSGSVGDVTGPVL